MLTGDSPSRDGLVAYLSRRIPALHVGGATALDWRITRHHAGSPERVVLWGESTYEIASWVDSSMAYTYQSTRIFDGGLKEGTGMGPIPHGNTGVLVSVPERALLELASDVGKKGHKGLSFEEAVNLMPAFRDLRPAVLDLLLAHCNRVKVVRLARDLGKAVGHPWAVSVQAHLDRLCAGKRLTRTQNASPRPPLTRLLAA
jgi:hypothetical protein